MDKDCQKLLEDLLTQFDETQNWKLKERHEPAVAALLARVKHAVKQAKRRT